MWGNLLDSEIRLIFAGGILKPGLWNTESKARKRGTKGTGEQME